MYDYDILCYIIFLKNEALLLHVIDPKIEKISISLSPKDIEKSKISKLQVPSNSNFCFKKVALISFLLFFHIHFIGCFSVGLPSYNYKTFLLLNGGFETIVFQNYLIRLLR